MSRGTRGKRGEEKEEEEDGTKVTTSKRMLLAVLEDGGRPGEDPGWAS